MTDAGRAGGAPAEGSAAASGAVARQAVHAPQRMPAALPQALVFDMDGLMFDTERLERDLWRGAAQRHGFDIPPALNATLVGRRAVDAELLLLAHFGAQFPLEHIKADVQLRWERVASSGGMPRKPGLEELLAQLERARIPKAVATSTARAKALVALGALADRFQALACGDEVMHGKPAPDIYLLAAQRLGIVPEACLALEDSPPGVTAARGARMPVIMIPDLVEPPEPPEFICASLEQVSGWLQSQLAARR